MELGRLVELAARVRATAKKTEKVALIARFLRETRERETELAALYLSGTLPQGRIGVGWRTLEQALAERARAGRAADAGGRGPHAATRSRPRRARGRPSGGSARAEGALVARAGPDERRFLVELFVGETRQGALEGVAARRGRHGVGACLPADVRQAAMYSGDVGEVARAALEEGAAGLARFSLHAALARRADAGEHGGRRRARRSSGWARRRSSTRSTARASRSTRRATRCASSRATCRTSPRACRRSSSGRVRCRRASWCVEGEAIALRADGRPHPFQVTGSRIGRSKDVEAARAAMPLSSFFFDCLLPRGEGSLVALPYAERARAPGGRSCPRALLPRHRHRRPREAARFLRRALDAGHEGVMAKSLEAPYAAGQRGFQLAEAEGGAHARPRRARGGVGQRPPPGVAVEPAPGRARSRRAGSSSCSARRSRA